MRNLLEQIQKGLENNLYFLSLFTALSMPDICGAIESQDGKSTSIKYEIWFNKYVASQYEGFLTGADCYKFRCSLLHQGSSQHYKSGYSRVLFIEPSNTTNVCVHKGNINDALIIDVCIFCRDIINGVNQWLKKVENTESYKANCDKFMRRYPNGLNPYIVGIPVIS
jgi:hypothetical protein